MYITASIYDRWRIYSENVSEGAAFVKTSFSFNLQRIQHHSTEYRRNSLLIRNQDFINLTVVVTNNIVKILMLGICISLQSCAQSKKEKETATENKKMDHLEHQKEGMLFKLKYEHADCSYEILINDMPVASHFGLGERSGLTVNLNQYILQPGKQEVTIRLYPSKKDETAFAPSLSSNSFVKVEISKNKEPMSMLDQMDAKDKGQQYQWQILSYQTPKLDDKPQNFVEYKTSFIIDNKDINWKIADWNKSQNLQNSANTRKEVDAFYSDFKKTLEEGNQQKYLSMLKQSIRDEAASTPWNKDAEKDLTKSMAEYAVEKRNFIYPCTDAELKFYGGGKVVTLVCKDPQTYGYSPLISKTAKNMLPKVHTFYLHKPGGSDKLEILR